MTAAILLVSVAVLLVLAVAGWAVAWWQSGVIGRLTAARHACPRPCGDASPARPGTTPEQAAVHADAMHEINRPFLPSGSHAQTWPLLTERTVPVKPTDDRAPWETRTAAQPVLSQAEQDDRAEYIASRMREADKLKKLTPEVMREAMAGVSKLAPAPEPAGGQTLEMYFGGAPVADVLAEQEGRLAS